MPRSFGPLHNNVGGRNQLCFRHSHGGTGCCSAHRSRRLPIPKLYNLVGGVLPSNWKNVRHA